MLHAAIFAFVSAASAAPVTAYAPADTSNCIQAARFLRSDVRVRAIVEPDTIDDWRTRKRVAGCRITSAGSTALTAKEEAVAFYDRLRAAGWKRTPEPIDSPNEGSLRFRWEKSDCLFSVNDQALLNTDAEMAVNNLLSLKPAEHSFQVFVMCLPAMPAAKDLFR